MDERAAEQKPRPLTRRTITRTEYLQLECLAALARKHYLACEECITAMQAVIGTAGMENRETFCDAVFAEMPIERVLDELQVAVSQVVVQ